jgi:hypothetical protein
LLACWLTGPGFAGIFGKKPAKPNPAERVPELITILKTDGDENKRMEAAEELRYFDPTAFPQIVPALIDVLRNDAKPSVRSEAADTLGKLRPVSQAVGQALEQARDKDPAMRVRLQARSSLLGYAWSGYKPAKPNDPPPIDKAEPTPPAIRTQPSPQPRPNNGPNIPEPPAMPAPDKQPAPIKPPTPPAPPAPQPSQPKFSFFGFGKSSTPPMRSTEQTKEPPLAPPLPQENSKPAVEIGPPQAPSLPIPTQGNVVVPAPASPQGPELPPQD